MNNLKTIISLHNLNKVTSSGRHILKGINLNVFPGELIGLLGHSGCGKSTLMNIICGIDLEHSGDVYIRDNKANNMDIYSRRIRFLDNNTVLFDYMNVFDNIKIGFGINSLLSEEEKREKIINVVSMLKLEDILFLNPSILSHGQQQKIKFARAIVDNPEIVMLDEPFDGLDGLSSEIIYKIVDHMNAEMKTTFIISSHDTYEILDLAKRLIIMHEGEITVDRSKNELLLNHNYYSWQYFNIGSILNGLIVDVKDNNLFIKIDEDIFILDIEKYMGKISGEIAVDKHVLLYVDPRSQLGKFHNYVLCSIVKIIDFIFYYQNICKYNDNIIQINTTNLLDIDRLYFISLDFVLAEIID